jgi:hypothetical protein
MSQSAGDFNPHPLNQKLYSRVKTLANKKFKSPSGIYRSSWIVREYKKRGGKYSGSKSKSTGLKRWYKENWVDLNRPKRNSKGKIIGYHKCGRKSVKSGGKYPICRPSRRITHKTPKTYKQLSKSSIEHAKRMKEIYKYSKNVVFNKKSNKSRKRRSLKKRSPKRSQSGGGFDKKTAKFPRRFSKSYCLKRSCNKMGFTEKASCRYYKNCYK